MNQEQIGPMFNPPHPGEVIQATYLTPMNLSIRNLAKALGVAPSTLARVVAGTGSVSPEMAVRLEAVLGRSAKMWLNLQENYDLWVARQQVDTASLSPLLAKELVSA